MKYRELGTNISEMKDNYKIIICQNSLVLLLLLYITSYY